MESYGPNEQRMINDMSEFEEDECEEDEESENDDIQE